jgi:hypothetical protein
MTEEQPKCEWRFLTIGMLAQSSPAIAPDDTVYIGSKDCLYARLSRWQIRMEATSGGLGRQLNADGGSRRHRLHCVRPRPGCFRHQLLVELA